MRRVPLTALLVGGAVLGLAGAATGPAPAVVPPQTRSDPSAVILQRVLPRPAVGRTVRDPSFGTAVRRLSGLSGYGGFEAPIYSQLQAFSTDNGYVLLDSSWGYRVRAVASGLRRPLDSSTWNAPRWDPAAAHSVLHFDANDNSLVRVQRTDVVTGTTRTIFTFPAQYRTVLSSRSFDEVSRNGRWMAGMVTRADGQRTVFVLDLRDRRLTVERTIASLYAGPCRPDPQWGEVEPDWVGVSPLGRSLVVQWTRDGTTRCSGLETFGLANGVFQGRVYDGHQHGDLGVTLDGRGEFFMTFELYHPSGRMALGVRALPGRATVSPPRYLTVLDWGNGGHISCQGPNARCLVSTSGNPADGWGPLERELFVQRTNGSILRLVHHRSSECGYFTQPRATWSRDGRRAIYASDWGTGRGDCNGRERSDPVILTLR